MQRWRQSWIPRAPLRLRVRLPAPHSMCMTPSTVLPLVLHHSKTQRAEEGRADGHDILLWTVRQRVERMEAGEGCLVHNLPSPLASTAGRIAQSGGKRDAELGIGRSRKTEGGGKDGSPTRHLPLRIGMEKKRHQHPQSCILPRAHTNRLIKFGWHRNGIISRRTRPWWGRMRPWLLLRRC